MTTRHSEINYERWFNRGVAVAAWSLMVVVVEALATGTLG